MKFLRTGVLLFVLSLLLISITSAQHVRDKDGQKERKYLVESLVKIADPVLTALSQNQLVAKMPVEELAKGREKFTYLEAFGRLLAGMAPWLELGPDSGWEGRLRGKYIKLARLSLHNATDPNSPDFMNFSKEKQPVVDAAFLYPPEQLQVN